VLAQRHLHAIQRDARPVLFPMAFIVGLGAAWVRERTGSSFNFVVAHAANSVTFLAAAYVMGA
jgi:membrane protease YdiL (CAAX protease family)